MRYGSVAQCQELINDPHVSNDTILHGLNNEDLNVALAIVSSMEDETKPRRFSSEQMALILGARNTCNALWFCGTMSGIN
jgi:hypothetical protein